MNSLISSAALSTNSGDPTTPAPTSAPTKVVTPELKSAWNEYIDYLDSKGLKGHPSLDHNNLGHQMMVKFKEEHPDTPLTPDMVIPIQQEFSKYRDETIKKIKAGKAGFAPGTNEKNFLQALSIIDGIPGQRTSAFKFPVSTDITETDGKVMNKGYAENGVDDSPTVKKLHKQVIKKGFAE